MATQDTAVLVFRKVFKNSSPEFVELRIRADGSASFDIRRLDDEPLPRPFTISPELTHKLFELAAQLNYFEGLELDVKRRIAHLGTKTFRYEADGRAHETSFNYTLNATANQLLKLFEGLGRQLEHMQSLERSLRYDRLGINDALLRLEADLNRNLLPEPTRLVPLLETIAADDRIIEIARQRARALIARLQLPG
ncbi:MAG: hypothetical protein K6U02_01860 [Firmicutes bacterium]|nr:hypothetical protein [Bacillota bacterium]